MVVNETTQKWLDNNKDRVSGYNKKYRDNHKEIIREYARLYRETHREERKEYLKNFPKDKLKEYQKRWKDNRTPATKERLKLNLRIYARKLTKKRKRLLVDYKGGKCERCGYNKNLAALEFHHIDPKTKEFNMGRNLSRDMDKLKLEVDKCMLLCANCHKEEHNPDY